MEHQEKDPQAQHRPAESHDLSLCGISIVMRVLSSCSARDIQYLSCKPRHDLNKMGKNWACGQASEAPRLIYRTYQLRE